MKTHLARCFLLGLLILLASTQLAAAQTRGVIDDPDGFVNVRADKSTDSAIIAKVKVGEPFTFEREDDADWCKVTLRSGKTGWMHYSRIRLHVTEADLSQKPKGKDNTELGEYGRSRKVDYYAVLRRAARGEAAPLKQFLAFAEDVDGGAAEGYYSDLGIVAHLVGDEKLATLLRGQPLSLQTLTRRAMADAQVAGMDLEYFKMRFPKTSAVFYRAEIIGWPSPDGKFAIRKTIANPDDAESSKVTRAELIEKSSGTVVLDLTTDDIGTGEDREGAVLWSPDSKRFAYMSVNLRVAPPAKTFIDPNPSVAKKQTTFYQKTGDQFAKVPVPLEEPPGRKEDRELKGATIGHEYTEPMRWIDANTAQLERHDYYETRTGPGGSLLGVGRLYDVTVTFPKEGEPTVKWKRNEDR